MSYREYTLAQLALQDCEMDPGDGVHVAACRRESVLGGRPDVFESKRLVSESVEVEAEIEMCIELAIQLSTCGSEDFLRAQLAAEHFVDLTHRDARVGTNRK